VPADSPLPLYRLISTDDADAAQAVVSRELTNSRIKRISNTPQFRFEMSAVHFGESLVAWNSYATNTDISSGRVEDTVAFVLGHRIPVFRMDEESIACTKATGVVVEPSTMSIERPAKSDIFVLKTTYQAIERRFWEVTKREPKGRIRFARNVDISRGPGAQASRTLMHVLSQLDTSDVLVKNDLLRVAVDDLLLGTLLSLPHSHRNQLFGSPGDAAASVVQRAEEYLEAHATKAVRMRDVAEACECSISLLYRVFERYRKYTPGDFLKYQRLEAARRMILSPSLDDTVTSIASACGFPHLGRFAAAYNRRFGETPSETLRRVR
jgi:AraC-like DNA-binding protein